MSIWSCLAFVGMLVPHAFAGRLKLNELTLGLYPSSRMLTNRETYILRDAIELILQDSLLQNSPQRSSPNLWPGITYVGLERVLVNSFSAEGVVKVSMDGLVYFFVPRDDAYIPENEEFISWVSQEILTSDVLLESLKDISVDDVFVFQNLTYVAVWDEFYEKHSVAPTGLPSSAPSSVPTETPQVAPSIQPTVAPTASPSQEPNPTTPLPTSATPSGDSEDMSLIGVAAGGGVGLLLIVLLCCCCRKKCKGEHPPSDTEKAIDSSPNSKTVCSDEEESSIQIRKSVDPPKGRSLFGYSNHDFEMDEMSDESFEEESFDDDGFGRVETIQPRIVVPNQQETFQPRVYNIQKDMLESSAITMASTAQQPKSILGLPPTPATESNCVLEPTDVSAATLAEAGKLSRQTSTRSDSSRQSYLVPKVVQSLWNRDEKTEDVSSVDGGSNFSGWDPDETSSVASEDHFFSSNIPNPTEQSLLQHSLRNESFKMQRLRTPEQKSKF